MLALKVRGDMENISPICINDIYPMGQAIRGAFGDLFLDMGLKIAETYLNTQHQVLYYRDAIVKHGDGGNLLPNGARTYICDICKKVITFPVITDKIIGTHIASDSRVNSFYMDAIVSNNIYNFEVIINMKPLGEGKEEERLADLLSAIKFVETNGINIGKRHYNGLGKMTLKNVQKQEITKGEILRRSDMIACATRENKGKLTLQLMSDSICQGMTGDEIVRSARNAAKFFTEWKGAYPEPKITIVRKDESRDTEDFFDQKIDPITRIGTSKQSKVGVISRGSRFECLLDNGENLDNIYGNDHYRSFFNALVVCETLMGIGERSSLGKGAFKIS